MNAHPTGLPVEDHWYLISNLAADLDLVWSYEKRFCCEQLFRDQKSGMFQLASTGMRDPQRIDRLLLLVAIAVLAGSLQGYALSLAGLRRQVDPHWRCSMSFLRIGLAALQMVVADAAARMMDELPIPIQELDPASPFAGPEGDRHRPSSQRLRCRRECDQRLITRDSPLSYEPQC